jgi:hypothetical protein
MIRATIIADSVNPDGKRLTTFECTFPRWILAEINTHRLLSRNSASSRAIPIKKLVKAVWRDPAVPVEWGSNRAGMQAGDHLGPVKSWLARRFFLGARIPIMVFVWVLSKIGLHKQISNRLLEPWLWQTAIISATEWDNFFKLRAHKDAQPEFRALAFAMRRALDASKPQEIGWGGWHTPYIAMEARSILDMEETPRSALSAAKISAACCARVSYVRQRDRRSEVDDIAMCDRLTSAGHFSPLEHPAQAVKGCSDSNFHGGWKQLRKFYVGEDGR